MSEQLLEKWQETTLDKVSMIIGGGTPKSTIKEYWNGDIPWISIADFNNENRWICKTEKTITEAGLNNSSTRLLNQGDIIISARGTVGALGQLKRAMAFNQSCYGVRANKQLDQNFLFYLLKYNVPQVLKNTHGAVFDTITRETFKHIKIIIPGLMEQKSIAVVLSTLDDKIELLQKQNKTLEQMAQTIFKEWFVSNFYIEKQRLGNLVEVKRGGSPRPIQDYISETGYRWLKISDASATFSPFIFEIKECIKKEGLNKTTLLKAGSLVLSNSATPGVPKILAVDSCIHDGWLHFPKSRFSNEFLYLLFQEIRPQLIQQGNGSVFTNLKTDILKDYEAPLPSDKILQKFDNVAKPIFEKIYNDANQIQSLKNLRDTLLPKFMNGAIRIYRRFN
jgi:type I restriction enzyme S subunit